MAYEDFALRHNEQLKIENEKTRKENIELREQLNKKDKELIEKNNLIYDQEVRLKNYDKIADKAQKSGGSIVGLMNKFKKPQNE